MGKKWENPLISGPFYTVILIFFVSAALGLQAQRVQRMSVWWVQQFNIGSPFKPLKLFIPS